MYCAVLPVCLNSAYYSLLSLSLKFLNSNKPEGEGTPPKSVDFRRISLREICIDISDKTQKTLFLNKAVLCLY